VVGIASSGYTLLAMMEVFVFDVRYFLMINGAMGLDVD